MRFSGPEAKQANNENSNNAAAAEGAAFFITEDIRNEELFPNDGVEQIQEEKSYGSETANERKTSNQQMVSAEELQLQPTTKSPEKSNADLGDAIGVQPVEEGQED